MKINISPGMIIFILGFCGLVFSLAEGQEEIGSKIPLALFFLSIMGVGIAIYIKTTDNQYDTFGEMSSPREFG